MRQSVTGRSIVVANARPCSDLTPTILALSFCLGIWDQGVGAVGQLSGKLPLENLRNPLIKVYTQINTAAVKADVLLVVPLHAAMTSFPETGMANSGHRLTRTWPVDTVSESPRLYCRDVTFVCRLACAKHFNFNPYAHFLCPGSFHRSNVTI